MAFICAKCGSLNWVEVVERFEEYELNESGEEEEVGSEYGELLSKYCSKCNSENLICFGVWNKPEIAKKLLSIEDGKERLKEFLFLVLENKIEAEIEKDEIIEKLKELGVSEDEIMVRMV